MKATDEKNAVPISLERGASAELPFYSVSTPKLVILSLTTFGIYELYWFYQNWKRIQQQSGSDIRPFWRAFFSPLFCHPLVVSVNSAAESLHLAGKLPATVIMAAYVGLLATHRLPDPWWMISMFSFLPLIPIQRRIQEIHEAIQPGRATAVGWSVRSVLATALGSVLLAFTTSGFFGPPTKALPAGEIPDAYVESLVEAGVLDPGERVEFFYSNGLFSILEDGNLFTDRRVVSYETADGELSLAAAGYDEIRDIDVEYSEGFEPSTVTVSTQDGGEFVLLVSAEDGRDHEFVEQLQQHLPQAAAPASDAAPAEAEL
jgi:hypothetical protein